MECQGLGVVLAFVADEEAQLVEEILEGGLEDALVGLERIESRHARSCTCIDPF